MISSNKVSGHFTLLKYNADTGGLVETRDFDNLITDWGLMEYCKRTNTLTYPRACVGVGTAEPTVEDTTLESFVAASDSRYYDHGGQSFNTPQSPDYISTVTDTVRFNAGTFDGTNLTEVGVCAPNSPYNVWCRALILDEQGQPSSITVLNNEYLDVRYILRFHPDLNDGAFSFEMDGITYNCTTRIANATRNVLRYSGYGAPLRPHQIRVEAVYNSTSTLGPVTGIPIYSSGGTIGLTGMDNGTNIAWSSEHPFSLFTRQTMPLNYGNFSDGKGIGCMLVKYRYSDESGIQPQTQIQITPPLPKNVNAEFTFVFGHTIGRWTPPAP